MDYDHLQALGPLGLASRFRRLAERLASQSRDLHKQAQVDFEPRWFPLFSLLLDAGSITVGEAARSLSVSHVAISRLAGQMKKRGLIEAEPDPDDRRATRLVLSEKGSETVAALEPLWDYLSARWQAALGTTRTDVLGALDALDQELLQ
ncbi:MAG: MarR family winged helix-turn-helix transcriptional regulator, partial [Longimicrobiales bacterium]